MIDLNSDMGELHALFEDGTYFQLLDYVTSINLACGGHAGNTIMMRGLSSEAIPKGINIGAHPSYPDKENFGRIDMDIEPEALIETIMDQIQQLNKIVTEEGYKISHVKPHGALYNRAAKDKSIADLIGKAVFKIDPTLKMVGLAGSAMVTVWRTMGFHVLEEAFADRAYDADGSLRNRHLDQALITNPEQAAVQAKRIAEEGKVVAFDKSEINVKAQTLCIHSDTPNALEIAKKVYHELN